MGIGIPLGEEMATAFSRINLRRRFCHGGAGLRHSRVAYQLYGALAWYGCERPVYAYHGGTAAKPGSGRRTNWCSPSCSGSTCNVIAVICSSDPCYDQDALHDEA